MNTYQKIFLTIIIIGGTSVLASYVLGAGYGNGADALWGGVPDNMKTAYTISMLLSALSFFVFSIYIFKGLGSNSFGSIYLILFFLILVASALWIPLVTLMVANPSTLVWILIRVVLAVVGLASTAIFLLLLTISPRPTDAFYYSALIGILIFSIHTGILDAIVWPYFFEIS